MSKISFFSEPTEVYDYVRRKKPEAHFDYDEIRFEAHKRVFTIAKMTNLDLLDFMQNSLADAYKNGVDFKEWQKSVRPALARAGWLGDAEVSNPKTGEVKQIHVGARRLRKIYDTNMRAAYAHARYDAQMNSTGKWFRYVALLDQPRPRPAHRALHGLVLPKDDPFWATNYPPNGWHCHCKVQCLTDGELKSRGLSPASARPQNIADPDWSGSPAQMDNLAPALTQKAARALSNLTSTSAQKELKAMLADLEHERDLYAWQIGLDKMLDNVVVKNELSNPLESVQIGFLSQTVAQKARNLIEGGKFKDKEIKSGGIILTKDQTIHASPVRKENYGEALRLEEMRQIVRVLNGDENAYIDLRPRQNNVIFIFKDEKNEAVLNYISIEVKRVLKKFNQSNYLITFGKKGAKALLDAIKGGQIIKVID